MKFYIKLLIAFFRKFKGVIITSILVGAGLFLFLLYILPKIAITNTKKIGYTGRYTIDNLPYEISSLIGQGLVTVTDNYDITPLLSKSWSIEESGKRWIFNIKDNVYWQDKKPFSAKEINYNFSDVSVNAEKNQITFELKDPYIPFIVLLEKPIFKKGLLGTGEWKVTNLSVKGEFIQNIEIAKDHEKRVIKYYPTEEQTKFAFKMGEVNAVNNLSSIQPFNDWNDVKIEENIKNDQVVVIFFNTMDPYLTDKNFRLALNYAIDKNLFKNRAIGPINPKSYFYNPQVKSYDFDPDKAKDLLKASKTERPKDYVLKIISTPNLIDTADKISKMWRDIGINSNVLVSSVIPSDYQALMTIYNIPKDPDQYSLWHSTQTQTNITKYKNIRIDKLLEDGRVELNKEERKKIYLDFQRFLVEDSPAIFLYHPIWYNISRK